MFPGSSIMMGMSLGFPDTCNTCVGTAVSPIPYPNIAMVPMSNPATASMKVLYMFMPACNINTTQLMSNGDEVGISGGGGVSSAMVMGQTKYTFGATGVMVGGQPATTMLCTSGHNGASPNCPLGAQLVPSQPKIIVSWF